MEEEVKDSAHLYHKTLQAARDVIIQLKPLMENYSAYMVEQNEDELTKSQNSVKVYWEVSEVLIQNMVFRRRDQYYMQFETDHETQIVTMGWLQYITENFTETWNWNKQASMQIDSNLFIEFFNQLVSRRILYCCDLESIKNRLCDLCDEFITEKQKDGIHYGMKEPDSCDDVRFYKILCKNHYYYPDDTIIIGAFMHFGMSGLCKIVYPSGDKVLCEFKGHMENGLGNIQKSNGEYYQGSWVRGKQTGTGVKRYSNGDVYIGEFEEGKPNGSGTLYFANGEYFEAIWSKENFNYKRPYGTYYYTNGDIYFGQMQRNENNNWERTRYGRLMLRSGEVQEGYWTYNILHESCSIDSKID